MKLFMKTLKYLLMKKNRTKSVICGTKKSRFIKKQEADGLLNRLGLKTPLSKIPLLVDILF